MKWSCLTIGAVLLFLMGATPALADVITYNAPVAASGAPDFSVKADGKDVFVNHARIAGYAIFSCDGPVSMEVTWMGAMDSVVVRPLHLGIKPTIEGRKITFTLPKPTNVSVEINDLIHVEGSEGTFTIHNGDRANVSHVLYENIRVEEAVGYLIDFKILKSRYSKDTDRGRITDIRFKNIEVTGDVFPTSLMHGFDAAHCIDGVILSDFRIQGKAISSEAQLKLDVNQFVKGLVFE